MRSLPLLLVVLLSSNALAQNTGPTPAPTPKPSPTPTPRPSPTPTPRPSPTPTPRPSPTPTPRPSPTPTPRPSPTPTPAPPTTPPPQFARWQSDMLTFGSQHCLDASRGTEDERLGADLLRLARGSISTYCSTRETRSGISASRPRSTPGAPGSSGTAVRVPGYWNFTGGLRLHFEQTGDTVSRSTVALLAANASFCADTTPADYTASASLSREVAYCIESRLDAMALGVPKTAYYDLMVTDGAAAPRPVVGFEDLPRSGRRVRRSSRRGGELRTSSRSWWASRLTR